MKIYFEFVFLINFLLDFMILYGTKRILKLNIKIMRLFLGSLFGSLTTFLLFINISNSELFIFKIILSIIIILISFGKNNFIRNICYFYLISIIVGGTIYLFDLNNSYYFRIFIIICSIPFIIYVIKRELSNYKNIYQNKYLVSIYYLDRLYNLEGFIDTGNRLVSPIKKEAVILVNLNIKFDNKKVIYVPFKALNTQGVIPCIRPDKVIIDNIEFTNCLIGISNDKFALDGANCILPNIFKEKLC